MSRPKKRVHPSSHAGVAFGRMSLRQYAFRSTIPIEKLKAAIDGEYIKVLVPNRVYKDIIIEVPSPSVTAWLREMLKPVAMRPLIRMKEIADYLAMPYSEMREMCRRNQRIKLISDPAFGELLTPQSIYYVMQSLPKSYGLPSFDRMRMINFFSGDNWGRGLRNRVLPYSQRIERECKRIANLKEPYRTIRAIALMEAMRDAKTIVECSKIYKEEAKREEAKLAEGHVKRLLKTL